MRFLSRQRFSTLLMLLLFFATPVFAQGSYCTLPLYEASRILDGAASADDAQRSVMLNAAQTFIHLCLTVFDDSAREVVLSYDPAEGRPLAEWGMLYGGIQPAPDSKWELLGVAGAMFVQGTASAAGDRLVRVDSGRFPAGLMQLYKGRPYPVYYVTVENRIRLLALVEKGRGSSQFFDMASGELISWEGNWRELEPVIDTRTGIEIQMMMRLDTPESFLRIGLTEGLPESSVISNLIEVRSDAVRILERGTADQPEQVVATLSLPIPLLDTWHSLKIIVKPHQFMFWIDDESFGYTHDELEVYPTIAFPLLETSPAPATISLDDIEIAVYTAAVGE